VAVPLFQKAPHVLFDLGRVAAVGMGIERCGLPASPAEELVDRHAGEFALYVPKRGVHACERVVQHRSLSPVGAHVEGLVNVLHVIRVPADDQGLQVPFDRLDHGQRALGEGGQPRPYSSGSSV